MALAIDPDPLRRALNRITFGARLEDVQLANSLGGLSGWLDDQFNAPLGDDGALNTQINAQVMRINYAAPAVNNTTGMWTALDEMRPLLYLSADTVTLWEVATEANITYAPQERTRIRQELIAATWLRNTHSRYQLREFMTDFWSNHFNIGKAESELSTAMLPRFDADAIRPYVFGNFRQMLEATATSPAMLIYLDNWLSTATTPNENYGREIMELHTLGGTSYRGVDGAASGYAIGFGGVANGFTDADIVQNSRILSGWTIKNGQRSGRQLIPSTGEFFYNAAQHNTTATKILNVDLTLEVAPMAQGRKMMDVIAYHPNTAVFIVNKLCVRIFGDAPPATAIARGIAAWMAGVADPLQIRRVLEAIILGGTEIQTMNAIKIRRPYERLIALSRLAGITMGVSADLSTVLDGLNDGPYAWQGPNGRPDVNQYWLASGTILNAWNLLIAFPGWAANVTNMTAQTPANVLSSATAVVEYWVNRLVGFQLDSTRMSALVNDQNGGSGVPSANTARSATRIETALRRLVSMIATTYEFTYR